MGVPEFKAPQWLEGQDAETIQRRMMGRLPPGISDIQGDFPWDLTMPSALEKSELLEYHAVELLKLMFPQWATGRWLDLHAKAARVERRPANAAYGHVALSGVAGTVVPAGTALAVPAVGDTPALEFRTREDAVLTAEGATTPVEAAVAGTAGNVAAGTITLMVQPVKGITGLTNPEPTSGGTEEEDDEELRRRILEAYETQDVSYVGCDADYVRWAREISGVGNVQVLANWDPEAPNSVKVIVLDSNGQPANDKILGDVRDNIMGPEDAPLERKAPVGALVTVAAPDPVTINYAAQVILGPKWTARKVTEGFADALLAYYPTAKAEGVVRYTQVHALLAGVAGVVDFSGLTLNGGTGNVPVGQDGYPVTGEVAVTAEEAVAE